MQKRNIKLLHLFFCCSSLAVAHIQANAQGYWTQKASLPDTARVDAMSFAIGTKGYVAQGAGGIGFTRLSSVWEYDASANSWLQKQNFTGLARWQGISFTIGSKGYIGTGVDVNNSICNDLWEYDPNTDTWTQKASMPTAGRHFASGFSIGNKGYVGLGWLNPSATDDFWEYDPLSNSWTQKANFPSARTGALGLSIGTKGYAGIGVDQTGTQHNDFWEYDPSTDAWTQKSNFPGGIRDEIDGAHFAILNYGYAGTGRAHINNSMVYYNDFWRYNSLNDSWGQLPNLPASPRIGAIGFTINYIGYVGLGHNGTSALNFNDLWSYTDTVLEVGTTTNDLLSESGCFKIPNVFSPCNGALSDVLNPECISKITSFDCKIFNSLGQKVYSTSDTRINWNGKECPPGLYSIVINYTDHAEKKYQVSSPVFLLR